MNERASSELQVAFYRNVLGHDLDMIVYKTGLSEQRIINILRKIRTRSIRKVSPSYYYLMYSTGVRKKVYRWSSKYELCKKMKDNEIEEFLDSINYG